MSNDKYHDVILAIITEHGELGVNKIAELADMPLSTTQKYLERQSYFKKTERRKWDLPHNVNADIKSDTMVLMVASVENALMLLNSQLTDLQESAKNALVPVTTLKRGIETLKAPVVGKTVDIDPQLLKVDKKVKDLYALFKQYVKVVPEEYQDLIKNVDLCRLFIEKGINYLNGELSTELTSLFIEKSTELSDDVTNILKEYQKGE